MKIIIGLGNPGKEYEKTKHNIGWLFLDYLSEKYFFEINKKFKDSIICETSIKGEKIIFVKPQTFMNLSGVAVQNIKSWYKVENKDILIIYDDIDISFGKIRYREKGSGGTHNGMKNVVQCLGTQDIPRLRIGTGGIMRENEQLIDFVLSKFSNSELIELQSIFKDADEKFQEFLDNK